MVAASADLCGHEPVWDSLGSCEKYIGSSISWMNAAYSMGHAHRRFSITAREEGGEIRNTKARIGGSSLIDVRWDFLESFHFFDGESPFSEDDGIGLARFLMAGFGIHETERQRAAGFVRLVGAGTVQDAIMEQNALAGFEFHKDGASRRRILRFFLRRDYMTNANDAVLVRLRHDFQTSIAHRRLVDRCPDGEHRRNRHLPLLADVLVVREKRGRVRRLVHDHRAHGGDVLADVLLGHRAEDVVLHECKKHVIVLKVFDFAVVDRRPVERQIFLPCRIHVHGRGVLLEEHSFVDDLSHHDVVDPLPHSFDLGGRYIVLENAVTKFLVGLKMRVSDLHAASIHCFRICRQRFRTSIPSLSGIAGGEPFSIALMKLLTSAMNVSLWSNPSGISHVCASFPWAQVDEACVERVQARVRQRVLGLFEGRGY